MNRAFDRRENELARAAMNTVSQVRRLLRGAQLRHIRPSRAVGQRPVPIYGARSTRCIVHTRRGALRPSRMLSLAPSSSGAGLERLGVVASSAPVHLDAETEHHERRAPRAAPPRPGRQRSFPARLRRPVHRQRAGRGHRFGRRSAARRRKRPGDRDAGRQLRRRLLPPGERCASRRADLARRLRPAPGHARDGAPPRRRGLRGAGAQSLLPPRQGAAIRDGGERRLQRAGNAREARPLDGLDHRAGRRREGCRGLRRLPRRPAAGRSRAQDRHPGLLHGRRAGDADRCGRAGPDRRRRVVPRRRAGHRPAPTARTCWRRGSVPACTSASPPTTISASPRRRTSCALPSPPAACPPRSRSIRRATAGASPTCRPRPARRSTALPMPSAPGASCSPSTGRRSA